MDVWKQCSVAWMSRGVDLAAWGLTAAYGVNGSRMSTPASTLPALTPPTRGEETRQVARDVSTPNDASRPRRSSPRPPPWVIKTVMPNLGTYLLTFSVELVGRGQPWEEVKTRVSF